jgi:hypothetical protein
MIGTQSALGTPPRRLALVTGASAGLGAAFARAYAEKGLDVALTARRADRLEALAVELSSKHGIAAFAVPADLSVPEAHTAVMAAVAARGRTVDVLVNNAGFGIPQRFAGVAWARQREFLMTMVVAACGLAHAVIPDMLAKRSGAIINVASLAAFAPGVAGNSLYPGAKMLMVKFSQALDAEYRAQGIRVTATCPGFTRTEFAEKAGIQGVIDEAPRLFSQSAEAVVEATLRANARGRVVVVPGWHNKLAAGLMQTLPGPLVRAIIMAGSAKYRLEDEAQ